MKVQIQNGNKEVELAITGEHRWELGGNTRIYYDLSTTGKRSLVRKFYKVVFGTTKDHTINVNGQWFAFEYGVNANSKTKKAAIKEGLLILAEAL